MKAFLLTAGLGTRMRPLTDKTPKCLLSINGKPLLRIWLELLNCYDVDQVLINTHWQHEKVEQYIYTDYPGTIRRPCPGIFTGTYGACADDTYEINNGIGKKPHIQIFYESELLGSAGTLLANKDWISYGEPFFILYGDNLTNVNLKRMYDFHRNHDLPFTLGVFKADEPERCGIAEIDANGVVVNFIEKPKNPKSDMAFAGLCIADKRLFDFFPNNPESIRPLDIGFHVLPNLVGKMKAYIIEDFLMDIGTPESYEKAKKKYPQIIQTRLPLQGTSGQVDAD